MKRLTNAVIDLGQMTAFQHSAVLRPAGVWALLFGGEGRPGGEGRLR